MLVSHSYLLCTPSLSIIYSYNYFQVCVYIYIMAMHKFGKASNNSMHHWHTLIMNIVVHLRFTASHACSHHCSESIIKVCNEHADSIARWQMHEIVWRAGELRM